MTVHRVALAVTNGAPIFELAIPCEVFGRARSGLPDPWYDFRVCRPPGPPVHTGAGFVPDTVDGYELLASADTVVVTALADPCAEPPAELVDAVRTAHRRGARLVALCTGAFVLAEAGVLDGRRASTHWRYADELSRRYPAVRLDPSALFTDDGGVLTSGGTTAGIDLCLHIVACDHGPEVARTLARRLVVPAHRGGGQSPYTEPAPDQDTAELAPLLDWMRSRLDQPLTLHDLTRQADLPRTTLIRHFHGKTGTTPMKWLTTQRVERAKQLLATSSLGLDQIAEATGLGSPANLRHHFTGLVGVSPAAYRQSFTAAPGPRPDSR